MAVMKKRRKRVFDRESTRAYSMLLNYPTLDDARADVLRIARALRIPPKAVGGYLTQASTNPRVTKHLVSLGYSEEQIPEWFMWSQDPPAPPVESPLIVETQPGTRAPSHVLDEKLDAGHVPNAATKAPEQPEDKEPWLIKGWPLPEVDMSKLPPGYTMRTISGYEEAEPEIARMRELYLKEQELRRRERELQRPPTPEEQEQKRAEEAKRQEQIEQANFAFAQIYMINNADLERQKTAYNSREYYEVMEGIKEITSTLRDLHQSDTNTLDATVKALAPIFTPKPIPNLYEDNIDEIKAQDLGYKRGRLEFARGIKEIADDQKVKRRKRLHERYPTLFPDYQ